MQELFEKGPEKEQEDGVFADVSGCDTSGNIRVY